MAGKWDREAPKKEGVSGPVADVVLCRTPDELKIDVLVLLVDYGPDGHDRDDGERYHPWLQKQMPKYQKNFAIGLQLHAKGDPTDYQWVFARLRESVEQTSRGQVARHYLLGPGTSTMAACSMVISRLESCSGTLWQVDEKGVGCRSVHLPFDLRLMDSPAPAAQRATEWDNAQQS